MNEVKVFPDLSALTQAAAELVLAAALQSVNQRGTFTFVLSGGGTPKPLFRLLAEPPIRNSFPWQQIHFFWGDERCVPADHPESSYHLARTLFLSHFPIPAAHIHRAKGELAPEAAAQDYRRQLDQFRETVLQDPVLRFDLVLLGLGSDGHTASLFPGKVPPEAEYETVIAVTADYDGRPANRITLTPLVFNNARQLLFLVAGENKAEAVSAVLYGPRQPQKWPAQLIQPDQGQTTWLLDESAAKRYQR
jgi:6-phosphogluconolactonase